jgi:hypothetical protein
MPTCQSELEKMGRRKLRVDLPKHFFSVNSKFVPADSFRHHPTKLREDSAGKIVRRNNHSAIASGFFGNLKNIQLKRLLVNSHQIY